VSQLKESEKCINFLENNGWKFSNTEKDMNPEIEIDCNYYDKPNRFSVGIDSTEDKITFLDDSGDIYTCDMNIYALIGFLLDHAQIACNYKGYSK
jgi:hypothetical protein